MDFVAGWQLSQTLGEGAFGKVKLLTRRSSGEQVAMKEIDLTKHADAQSNVQREVALHRVLTHPNIVRCFGSQREGQLEYIFLEFVSGGDLFDRIAESDRGITTSTGQRYFNEILSGVEYLHSRGILHRDLKPENILLDEHDNLKICDFGLATVFRGKGMERALTKRCGTFAYMAPEVLMLPYHGEPADLWSCGIILVFLLTGSLPWEIASMGCNEYVAWKDGKAGHLDPFIELDNLAMDLIQKILVHIPSRRAKLKAIKDHQWCNTCFDILGSPRGEQQNKRFCCGSEVSTFSAPGAAHDGCALDDSVARLSRSQPEPKLEQHSVPVESVAGATWEEEETLSFSQPAHLNDMALNSQVHATQPSTQTSSQLTVTTTDKCDTKLKTMADFRLSKGCGLGTSREIWTI